MHLNININRYLILSLIIVNLCYSSFYKIVNKYDFNLNNKFIKEKINNNSNRKYNINEKICLHFIINNMSSKNSGIYTNFLYTKNIGELSTGHEILSESEGLIMLYWIKVNNKQEFDKHFALLKKEFLFDKKILMWRIKGSYNNITISSSSIDNLRILKALMYAYNKWQDANYYKFFISINSGLLKNNLYKGMLTNFYNSDNKSIDYNINLSYIDLYTMQFAGDSGENKWEAVRLKGLDTIKGGYISDVLPLYKKSYNMKYDEYDEAPTINLIDSLLVVLHLSEIGKERIRTIRWLKDQLKTGALYSEYNLKNGKPKTKQQSTAVYALAARIGKIIDDESLYNSSIEKMITLQVVDKQSKIYGSFGNTVTLQVFSFDNLEALLAF